MYASLNAFTTTQHATALPTGCGSSALYGCLVNAQWYVIQQIGVTDLDGSGASIYGAAYQGSEFRGVAPAPRSCSTTGQQFRALGAPEAEEEETA